MTRFDDWSAPNFEVPCRTCGGTGATPSSLYSPPGPCPCTYGPELDDDCDDPPDNDCDDPPDDEGDPNPACGRCGDKGVVVVDGLPDWCSCSDMDEGDMHVKVARWTPMARAFRLVPQWDDDSAMGRALRGK